MIITCEQCNTAFNLDESLLKPAGSKVRCSKCRHIFTAFPPAPPAQAPASTTPPEEKAPDLSDAAGAAAAASAAEDELDFSDPDFGDSEETEAEAPAPATTDEGELDLGDLELDLGGAEEDKTPEPEEAAEDELDISEFEFVLDEDDEEVDAVEELDVDDLDLDFELEPIEEGEKSQFADLEIGSDDEEIDLSELETMLGDQDEEQDALDAEMPSQQFDLDMELDMDEPEEASDELELDLEAEKLDRVFGDEEIEEIEDLDAEALEAVEPGEDRPATFAETVDMETLDREAAALEAEGAPAGPGAGAPGKSRREKSKLGKPVLVLLLLAVLGGGGYYAIDTMGVRIPYVSDLIRPAPDDVNRIEVMQATVRSKFVENAKTGKLFVITGRVRNGYEEARNFIGVTGNSFAKGKKVQSTSVFAGNALSDAQLSTMDMNAINKALRNRVGEKKSNMNVGPNQTLPFMIVFDKMTTELEEYTVEPGTSTAAQ